MTWKVRLALWLLKKERKYRTTVLVVKQELYDAAQLCTKEVNRAGPDQSGMWKREQALRMLQNTFTGVSETDCLNAIQAVLANE